MPPAPGVAPSPPAANGVVKTMNPARDPESNLPQRELSSFKRQFDLAGVTQAVLEHPYHGQGTHEDPYVVDFIPGDAKNPMRFPAWKKWFIAILQAVAVLAVSSTEIMRINRSLLLDSELWMPSLQSEMPTGRLLLLERR